MLLSIFQIFSNRLASTQNGFLEKIPSLKLDSFTLPSPQVKATHMTTAMDTDTNSLAMVMIKPLAMTTPPVMTMMTKTKLHPPAFNPTAMTSLPHHPHMNLPHTARQALL